MNRYDEINEKIEKGKAVVLTAEEVKALSASRGVDHVAQNVDVVTCATFSPMCSSGVFLNLGHTLPPLKMQRVTLDGVPAYGGIASVDVYLGATEPHPGKPGFGGAHVIERLIRGEPVELEAQGQPSDCYPRSHVRGMFTLEQINQAYFFNPRNAYQNYQAAVNSGEQVLETYMGRLQPRLRTIHYAGTGEWSPLINDPLLSVVGVGTPVFCCGGLGMVTFQGTQHNPEQKRDSDTGLPIGPGATLAIQADLRGAQPAFVKAIAIPGYGISLFVGIGVAIPVLNHAMARAVCIRDHQIQTPVFDYARRRVIGHTNYAQLKANQVEIEGKRLQAKTMTNMKTSRRIMDELKRSVLQREFPLRPPIQPLPTCGGRPRPCPA